MSSPSPTSGPLQNLYYKRPVGTPKPCSMCYRETRTVLWNPQDFIYICDVHLTDTGFASPVEPEAAGKVNLGEEELKKIKDEWEERQRKKKEKEEKQKTQENGDKKEEKSGAGSWLQWATGNNSTTSSPSANANANSSTATATSPPSSSSASTPDMTTKKPGQALFSSPGGTPSHQRFILNRQIFSIRQAEFRKKQKVSQANAIAPKLPMVPRNLS